LTTPPDRRPRSSEIAKRYVEGAANRAHAAQIADSDPHWSGVQERVASKLQAPMHVALTPDDAVVGTGTELALHMAMDPGDKQGLALTDTVRQPEIINARASVERLRLLDGLAIVEQAVDTAETIKPRDSVERMLAHQLAATHTMAMRFMATAQEYLSRAHPDDYGLRRMDPRTASVEAARLAGTAARLMTTFQDGVNALTKKRTGGKQVVRVVHQYVQVNEGGQAVVAGEVPRRVKGTGGKRRPGKGLK
jgi:hypothetical protein